MFNFTIQGWKENAMGMNGIEEDDIVTFSKLMKLDKPRYFQPTYKPKTSDLNMTFEYRQNSSFQMCKKNNEIVHELFGPLKKDKKIMIKGNVYGESVKIDSGFETQIEDQNGSILDVRTSRKPTWTVCEEIVIYGMVKIVENETFFQLDEEKEEEKEDDELEMNKPESETEAANENGKEEKIKGQPEKKKEGDPEKNDQKNEGKEGPSGKKGGKEGPSGKNEGNEGPKKTDGISYPTQEEIDDESEIELLK
uniref:Uncharacterized protein n=1 Tax=Panagrolaimus sp. JU765 TaxID=591449 RepID=A0AC34RB66_9BILA